MDPGLGVLSLLENASLASAETMHTEPNQITPFGTNTNCRWSWWECKMRGWEIRYVVCITQSAISLCQMYPMPGGLEAHWKSRRNSLTHISCWNSVPEYWCEVLPDYHVQGQTILCIILHQPFDFHKSPIIKCTCRYVFLHPLLYHETLDFWSFIITARCPHELY